MGFFGMPKKVSGDFKKRIEYDARAGRMFVVNRSQTAAGAWEATKQDVTRDFSFVPDFATLKVGWIYFGPTGPELHVAPLGEPLPPQPLDRDENGRLIYKRGFDLDVHLPSELGGGVREWRSNAGCVFEAVEALAEAVMTAPEYKDGKLAAVAMTSAQPIKVGQSTNYQPVFEIEGWVARSALPGEGAEAASAAPTPPAHAPAPATRQRTFG